MLRRAISFTLILLLLFLVYQFLINYVKSEHFVTYNLNLDHEYVVDEDYVKSDGYEYYILKVTTEDNEVFLFDVENKFNKQEKIVSDVLEYNDENVHCLTLLFKDNKTYSEPICRKDNELYSYHAIKETVDLSNYIKKIKNFDLDKYSKDSEKTSLDEITYNKEYLQDDEVIIMYGYKSVRFIWNKYDRNFTFSQIDTYKNTLGRVVDHYYVIPRYTSSATFSTFVVYEIIDGFKKEISVPYSISKQSYVNGVYDNKLYIFDKSNLTQYEIDPSKEVVNIVGDEQKEGFAYINGKETKVSVYDMNSKDVIFSDGKDKNFKNIDYDIIDLQSYYAIYGKDNSFYKVYEKYPEYSINLFTDKNAKEIKVRRDNIYYLKDDSIYRYNKYGNVLIATSSELKYNYENAFDIYLK